MHLEALRKDILKLWELNILEPMGESKWAHPSFITSKKYGTVCLISNLRELNKVITKFTKLFDGTLGVYPHRKVKKELLADTVAKHARPYSVP